jgi:hypothetical protein
VINALPENLSVPEKEKLHINVDINNIEIKPVTGEISANFIYNEISAICPNSSIELKFNSEKNFEPLELISGLGLTNTDIQYSNLQISAYIINPNELNDFFVVSSCFSSNNLYSFAISGYTDKSINSENQRFSLNVYYYNEINGQPIAVTEESSYTFNYEFIFNNYFIGLEHFKETEENSNIQVKLTNGTYYVGGKYNVNDFDDEHDKNIYLEVYCPSYYITVENTKNLLGFEGGENRKHNN